MNIQNSKLNIVVVSLLSFVIVTTTTFSVVQAQSLPSEINITELLNQSDNIDSIDKTQSTDTNFIIENFKSQYNVNEYKFINANCVKILDNNKILCGNIEITPLKENTKPNKDSNIKQDSINTETLYEI